MKTLEQRLLERPDCSPICAASPRLRLEATTTALLLRVEIDAAAETAVPLPGGAKGWTPSKVVLDGEPADALSQDGNGVLWLAVGAGKHQVVLDGPIPLLDTVEIPLPLKPHRIDAEVSGWTLSGIREDGLPEDSLRLVRERRGESTEPRLEPGFLPPFARLERELRLGLSWEVENVVTRLTPLGTAFHLEVPLLAGESVTGNVRVENGKALVVLGPSANQARWRSILKEAPTIGLKASENEPWTEVWRLDASPLWHVAAERHPSDPLPPNRAPHPRMAALARRDGVARTHPSRGVSGPDPDDRAERPRDEPGAALDGRHVLLRAAQLARRTAHRDAARRMPSFNR